MSENENMNEDLKVFGIGMMQNSNLHQLNALILENADLKQENRELRKTIKMMEMEEKISHEISY